MATSLCSLHILLFIKIIVIRKKKKRDLLLIFFFNMKYLRRLYKDTSKQGKIVAFLRNWSVKITLILFYLPFVVMTMVSTLPRQFRISLEIKKVIINALRVL